MERGDHLDLIVRQQGKKKKKKTSSHTADSGPNTPNIMTQNTTARLLRLKGAQQLMNPKETRVKLRASLLF